MKKLSYETLKEQNYSGYLLEDAPNVYSSLVKEISFVHLLTISSRHYE